MRSGWLRESEERRRASARRTDGRKSEGRGEWLASLSLSLFLFISLSRGVERYSFRGGGRLDEAVVVAEEENVEEVEEDGVRPINHGIIIESVISKAC